MTRTQLWVPPTARSDFKKATPPKLGEKFGVWANQDLYFMNLPGGGVLQFDLSKLTLGDYRSMREHYQVNANLMVLTFMMQRLDWQIECKDKKIRDFMHDTMTEHWNRLVRGLSQAFWSGYSPIVLQWENDLQENKIICTKFKDLVPEQCRVHWKAIEGYAEPNHAKPKLYVFDGIKQTPVGGVWSNSGTGGSHIPVENSFWYPLLMENGDHYGKKLLKPAFPSWFFSILLHLFANRYYERFGEPIPVGRADFNQEILYDGQTISGRDAMENILMALRNRGVVTLPSSRDPETKEYDFDIQYLESQMRGADFERYMTRLDEEISIGLFTPILLMRTADVGSYNLGVGHMQLFMWMLNALAGDWKEYIDRYYVNRMKDFNFGPNAPKAYWVPQTMGKQNVETMRAVVTELMRNDKVKPDTEELGQIIGLSLSEVRQVTEPEPLPGEPGGDEPAGQEGDSKPDDRQRNRPGQKPPRKEITAALQPAVELWFALGKPPLQTPSLPAHLRAWANETAEFCATSAEFMDRLERVL